MKRGEIYLTNLNPKRGSVQSGLRPVLVIQNNKGNSNSPTTIICCITSISKKKLPTHLFISKSGGLRKQSTVLCEQIFTINKSDLKHYIGAITDNRTLKELDRCIRISLGITKGGIRHNYD